MAKRQIDDVDIRRFARNELEEIQAWCGGPAYRCSATLRDGLHLPCVLLAKLDSVAQTAMQNLEERRADALLEESKRRFGHGMQYPDLVRSLVASRNTVSVYDIVDVQKSRYAIPVARLREVR